MNRHSLLLLVVAVVTNGVGATKSGIEEFWSDDYKAFEQIYGKTSDKDLYGETLPTSFSFGHDTTLFDQQAKANEKTEKALELDDLYNSETKYSNYGEKYLKYLAEQSIKADEKVKSKPAFKFVSYSDFKPITKTADPETYDYLKHLEQFENLKTADYPQTANGFKPLSTFTSDFDSSAAYKSIQDILDAHEANKARPNVEANKARPNVEANRFKYNQGKGLKGKVNKINPTLIKSNHLNLNKNRKCISGACKKRAVRPPPRYRPYVRRVKHKIIQY